MNFFFKLHTKAFLLNTVFHMILKIQDALGDCQNHALVNIEFYLINIIGLAFLYSTKKFAYMLLCTLFRNNMFMLDEIRNAKIC